MPSLHLKAKRHQSISRRHPWVFSRAVDRLDGDPQEGDRVQVLDAGGTLLGIAHYQARGSISARMLTFGTEPVDPDFWCRRIQEAVQVRRTAGLLNTSETNAFRLVHGEGDRLPGLIIDWYAGHAVLQPHSSGMSREAEHLARALEASPDLDLREVVSAPVGARDPEAPIREPVDILENGLRFRVRPGSGQKTGFYLDQRENRRMIRDVAPGRRVLDAFSYSGGFTVHALQGGATEVWTVDQSRRALEACREHVALNDLPEERFHPLEQDVLPWLQQLREDFDLVILDPPAFAKRLSARHAAIQAYRRLNAAALARLTPGGLLATFSCSQVVTPDLFRGALLAAGIDVARSVRILRQLHQPPDHPISLFHPEGEYLKGYLLAVD